MYDTPLTIEQILTILAATPSRLADLTEDMPPAQRLAVLEPLAPEAWARMATVTGAGKPRERTVYTYAQWLANHERSHIKQIERMVAQFA